MASAEGLLQKENPKYTCSLYGEQCQSYRDCQGKPAGSMKLKDLEKVLLGPPWGLEKDQVKQLFDEFDRVDSGGNGGRDKLLSLDEYLCLVGCSSLPLASNTWGAVAVCKKEDHENRKRALQKALELRVAINDPGNGGGVEDNPQKVLDQFDVHIKELQAAWREMTPTMFIRILSSLSVFENDPLEFIQSLAVTVHRTGEAASSKSAIPIEYRVHIDNPFDEVMLVCSSKGYGWDAAWSQDLKAKLAEFSNGGVKPFPYTSWCTRRGRHMMNKCRSRCPTEFRFLYTNATWLFDANNEVAFCYIVKCIKDHGVESGVFNSPVTRAILGQAWHCVEDYFLALMTLDVFRISLLILYGYNAHLGRHPSERLMFFILVAMLISTVLIVNEWSSVYFIWPDTLLGFLFGYVFTCRTVLTLAVQLYDFILSSAMWWSTSTSVNTCLDNLHKLNRTHQETYWWSGLRFDPSVEGCSRTWVHSHPCLLAYLVGCKCLVLMVRLLATRSIGEQVIPAYKALVHPSHLAFVAFMVIVVFSSFASYFMFPIKGGELNDVLWTFLTTFRLDISGDFDLGDLEGVNQKVVLNEYNATTRLYEGYTDDGDPDPRWHHGISFLFIILTIIINLMFLNVYIGLLSSLYESLEKQRSQHFFEYRARTLWKIYVSRLGWRNWRKRLGCEKRFSGITDCLKEDPGDSAHLWIAYCPTAFKESTEDELEALLQLLRQQGTSRTGELSPQPLSRVHTNTPSV